jgi:hypothetical protein
VFTSVVTASGNGDYRSAAFTTQRPGSYRWIATYSGDSRNVTVSTTCNDRNESVQVKPAARGMVTGGGQVVPAPRGKASFGFMAQRKAEGGPASGHFNYVNETTGLHINGRVTTLTILGPTSATFSGIWDADCTFTVYMEDNGEPGVKSGDRLSVSHACPTPPGSVIDAPLQILLHGNNQIHKTGISPSSR